MKRTDIIDRQTGLPASAIAFGRVLARNFSTTADPTGLALWAALCYEHLQQGRVAFDHTDPFRGLDCQATTLPPLEPAPAWLYLDDGQPSPPLTHPLVLRADGTCWLARYHDFDRRLRAHIIRRREQPYRVIDESRLRAILSILFPQAAVDAADCGQQLAAATLVDAPFGLITGGPGTGKTTSLAKLLLCHLLTQPPTAPPHTPAPILMLAPTGKAAQRLRTGLRRAVQMLRELLGAHPDLLGALDQLDPDQPETGIVQNCTIHKALAPRRQRRAGEDPFHHTPDHPITASLVIVDEVSMVDLALMTRLVGAVPLDTPLLWVGDAEQLESVEAGTVLSDIASIAHPVGATRQKTVAARTGLQAADWAAHWPQADHVRLTHNYRFGRDSAIGALARTVQRGDPDAFLSQLQQLAPGAEIEWIPLPAQGRQIPSRARDALCAGYADLQAMIQTSSAPEPEAAVAAFDRFRVLCATRQGVDGVEAWNQRLAYALFGVNPPVQALLITVNDPLSEWYNGDTGLVLPTTDGPPLFYAGHGRPGWPAALLPAHEAGWAMTIHKSQGSEYDHVAIVLPRRGAAQLLTRRLLYTALTRARHRITIIATPTALRSWQ